MNDKIIELLKKHKYGVTLRFESETQTIRLILPNRVQEPYIDASLKVLYKIGDESVRITADEQDVEIACPQYACRTLVIADVKRICSNIFFDTNLVEFKLDEDIITEEDFFRVIWPKGVPTTDEDREKELTLRQLVYNASTCIMPYDDVFYFEAQKANVEHGYLVIKSIEIGGS